MSLFLAHFYSYGVILCVPGSQFSSLPGLLFPGSITAFNICFHSLYKFFLLSAYYLSSSSMSIIFPFLCYSFTIWVSSLICCFIFILHIDFCHINSTFNFFQCGFYFSYWGFVSFLLTLSPFLILIFCHSIHTLCIIISILRGQVLLCSTDGIKSFFLNLGIYNKSICFF